MILVKVFDFRFGFVAAAAAARRFLVARRWLGPAARGCGFGRCGGRRGFVAGGEHGAARRAADVRGRAVGNLESALTGRAGEQHGGTQATSGENRTLRYTPVNTATQRENGYGCSQILWGQAARLQ